MSSEDRTRFEVLLESIESKVNVIAEGQTAIVGRLDRVENRLDRIEVRVENLEIKTDVVGRKVEALATDTTDIKERVVRIEKHLGLNGAPKRKRRKRTKRAA